jgi:hypothetical protein
LGVSRLNPIVANITAFTADMPRSVLTIAVPARAMSKFAGLSAGGRWIRTVGTVVRVLLGGLELEIGFGDFKRLGREKQIKEWKRGWKINLIECSDPHWIDLWSTVSP